MSRSVLIALLALAAAAPAAAAPAAPMPSGVYEVVALRMASDTASTRSMQEDDSLRRSLGTRMTFGKTVEFYDARRCSAETARPAVEPWTNLAEPNLSDLQVKAGPADRRRNQSLVVDCGGRAYTDIVPFLAVDNRVLVTRSRNGAAYLVLEAPLDAATARKAEQGLAKAGFDPGPVDGVIDERARRAVALYAESKGARFAFDRGVITENVLAALTAP